MTKIFSLLILIALSSVTVFSQTIPSKSRALKDFQLKKASIEKQLKYFGIESGLEGIKVEHTGGPYEYYSIGSRTYYYDHVSDRDAAYHTFKMTTPTYDNGDKFIFKVKIGYDSYEYMSTGYRKSLGKYALRSADISIDSYEGKELTNSLLLENLNKFSIEKGKELEVANKYHFYQIDELTFEKTGKQSYRGTTQYLYEIKIAGKVAEYMTQGDDYIEYEIEETADVVAFYNAKVTLVDNEWVFLDYFLNEDRSKTKISNVQENPEVPAYKCLRFISLKEIMNGPIVSDDISMYSYKYFNDIKDLVFKRLHEVPREEFIKGDLLTNLFSTEEGKSALNQFYSLRQTMEDYYLDSVKSGVDAYGVRLEKDDDVQFNISYRVERTASKELSKLAKAEGASKDKLAVIKKNGKGYYSLNMRVSVIDGKIVITSVLKPAIASEITYEDGSYQGAKHPLSIIE